jgi:hypothetical protein
MNQVGGLVEANVRRNVITAHSARPAVATPAAPAAANTPTPPSACGTESRAMSSISPPCAFEAYHWPITDEIDTAGTVATATGGAALSIEAAKVGTAATTAESAKEDASNGSLPQPSLDGPTTVPPPPPQCSVGFETILCADCLYESASLAPLERALRYVDA